MKRETRDQREENLAAGALAGLIGGLCMGLLMMLVSAGSQMGFFHPMALAGSLVYGVDGILGGMGPVVTGMVIHLTYSGLLGALFGLLLRPSVPGTARTTGRGLAFGTGVWALTTYLLLPVFNPTMKARVDLAPGWWFLSFLVYGLMLGVLPEIRKAAGVSPQAVPEESQKRAA